MVMYFSPNCVVKNPDIVGGIVEVKAAPKIGKISRVRIYSNNLIQSERVVKKFQKFRTEWGDRRSPKS